MKNYKQKERQKNRNNIGCLSFRESCSTTNGNFSFFYCFKLFCLMKGKRSLKKGHMLILCILLEKVLSH